MTQIKYHEKFFILRKNKVYLVLLLATYLNIINKYIERFKFMFFFAVQKNSKMKVFLKLYDK